MTIGPRFWSSIRRMGGASLVGVVATAIAYFVALWLTGNFHTVVAGEVYRSGQLTPSQLEKFAREYGIKTIVNLRGANAGRPWYDAELAESRRLGIAHLDFRMSARQKVSIEQGGALIALLKSAQRPVLIHCNGGADRSGLASALYLAAIANAGEIAAEKQLSIRFGHVSLPFIPEYAMDRSWERMEPSLGFPKS